MSRAQSPSREQTLTLNLLGEKMLQVIDAIQDLKNQMANIEVRQPPRERIETAPEIFETENTRALIKTYEGNALDPGIRWT